MKQVDAAQILNVEMVREKAPQFGCGEEVKAQHNMAALTKLDFALISAIIVFEMTRLLNRIYEDSRRAADRAHRGYEVLCGNARDFRGDLRQACDWQMTKDTVEAKREVRRGVGLRQFARKICNIECDIHPEIPQKSLASNGAR